MLKPEMEPQQQELLLIGKSEAFCLHYKNLEGNDGENG